MWQIKKLVIKYLRIEVTHISKTPHPPHIIVSELPRTRYANMQGNSFHQKMIRTGAIQLALVAVVAAQTLSRVYSPPVWEYARDGDKIRKFYLNTYHYCNYTSKQLLILLCRELNFKFGSLVNF
jgi:hypothetical protein